MSRFTRVALGIMVAFAAGCAVEPPTDGPGIPSGDALEPRAFAEGLTHVFVLTEERAPSGELLRAIQELGGEIVRQHDEIGVLTVAGLDDADAATLALRTDVDGADRDMFVRWIPPRPNAGNDILVLPEHRRHPIDRLDPTTAQLFAQFQWNLRVTQADAAWSRTNQGKGALVCVLDTGVDPNQIDLVGLVDLSKAASFVPTEPFIEDLDAHGTFVSSLIASNGVGMASVAPQATICPVKVLESAGENAGSGSFDWVIAGMIYAAHSGADVINMSLGAVVPRKEARSLIHALARAARYADRRGVLLVAAAGNDGIDFDQYPEYIHVPSMLEGVTSVSATAPIGQMNFDLPASYTNFGRRAVDVAAPGGDYDPALGSALEDLILGACSSFVCGDVDFYLLGAGTSFAAPHVAGAGAVVESMKWRDLDDERLQDCIYDGADNIDGLRRSPYYGYGRLNVLQAAKGRYCGGRSHHDGW